jgi:hypothetical protein
VFEEGVKLGDIAQDSLRDIWRGERLREIRGHHLNGTYPKGAVCTTCTDWASTRWDMGYERLIDKVVYKKPTLATELSVEEDE